MQSRVINFPVQYDLLESRAESEWKAMQAKIEQMDASLNKTRKALFARHGELNKKQMDLEMRLEAIERGLCYGS